MSDIGNLYVIAAPSGGGKTSLVNALLKLVPNLVVSISHTTRPKRPIETHGVNYYFTTEKEFNHLLEQEAFIEHAKVFDHYYGTSKQWVIDTLASGKDVILEIDWQGQLQIRQLFPTMKSIFILPPSFEHLKKRLVDRRQDEPSVIEKRLADARLTISHIHDFDYVVINDQFDKATTDLKTIIECGRLIERRQYKQYRTVIDGFGI